MTAIPRHAIVSATRPDIFRLSAPSREAREPDPEQLGADPEDGGEHPALHRAAADQHDRQRERDHDRARDRRDPPIRDGAGCGEDAGHYVKYPR